MQRILGNAARRGSRTAALALTGVALCLAALGGASPAGAVNTKLKEEFAPFGDCPTATANFCAVSYTTGGEFHMGNKEVPIDKTITLQGGLKELLGAPQPLIPAKDGNTLSNPALKVPGGLLGVGLLEGITGEVTATAYLAGGVEVNQLTLLQGSSGTAVILPLKVKLDNPLLGANCWIGSDEAPIVLHLAVAKKGTEELLAKKKIIAIKGVELVDETFAVPAAKGCGALPLLTDPLVDLLAGLPAGPGHNRAVMITSFEQAHASDVIKYDKVPKEKKKK